MTILYEKLPVIYDTGELLKDKTDWRTLKLKSSAVSFVMSEYENSWLKRSERMLQCGSILRFAVNSFGDRRLISAQFCRDRLCPACQKRRSLVVFHQLKNVCISVQEEYSSTRYLMLTLTVPNVRSSELNDEITHMNKSWARLIKRKPFELAVMGTFKALEVTYNSKAKTYHPHFHVLLAVNNSYFKGRNYIKHSQWLELWRKATKDNSITQVDVRAVTSNKKRSSSSDIESAAAEVGKYSTKPSDYLKKLPDGSYSANSSIVKDLAVNLKGRRLTSYTGVLKEHYMKLKLQDVESDNIDLVHISNDDDMIDAVMIQVYKWNVGLKNYIN